jgi:23S rRNA (adenine1618-N6)-methyltransferase
MVTPGGETAFVGRIIAESLQLRERVQWYTTMLGKLSSVPVVVARLKETGVTNWAVAEFVQGSRTRRWGVGWSFRDLRPALKTARAVSGGGGIPKNLLPFPGEFVVEFEGERERVGGRVDAVLSELPLRWMWKPAICTGVGFAAGNVWSRAARRKLNRDTNRETSQQMGSQGRDEDVEGEEDDEEEEMVFGFKINVREVGRDGSQAVEREVKERGVQVVIRWLKGFDSALFESFCGMMKRKLEE